MPAGEKSDIYNTWFKKLKPKEKNLVVFLLMAAAFSFYFSLFLKPMAQNINELKKQAQQAQDKAALTLSQFPNMDKIKNEMKNCKTSIEQLKDRAQEVEDKLLGASQVPQLLTELIKCAKGLTIDFQTVKQNIEADKNGFSHLYIDLKFESRYEEMINYLQRIEDISPFVKIEEIQVSQSKTDPRNLINSSLKLSAILASVFQSQGEFSKSSEGRMGEKLSVERNPLMPSITIGEVKNKTLKVIGITYRGPGFVSSAIINDTVVREGEEIDGYKAETISPDTVVLNNGRDKYTLTIER